MKKQMGMTALKEDLKQEEQRKKMREMSRRSKIFALAVMVLFLSSPLYMDYMLGSHELGIYFLDMPGLRGPFLKLPALFVKMGISMQGSCKLYLFLMNFAACVSSFWCFDRLAGGSLAGLFGSICYVFSIYSISIRYLSCSLGEIAAFALLPLVLYGFVCMNVSGPYVFWITEENTGTKEKMEENNIEETRKQDSFEKKKKDAAGQQKIAKEKCENAVKRQRNEKEFWSADRIKGILVLTAGLTMVCWASIPIAIVIISVLLAADLVCLVAAFCKKRWKEGAERLVGVLAAMALSLLLSANLWKEWFAAAAGGVKAVADGKCFAGRGLELTELLQVFTGRISAENTEVNLNFMSLGLPFLIVLAVWAVVRLLGFRMEEKRRQLLDGSCVAALCLMCLSLRIFPWEWISSLSGIGRMVLEQIAYPHRFLLPAVLVLSLAASLLAAEGMERAGKCPDADWTEGMKQAYLNAGHGKENGLKSGNMEETGQNVKNCGKEAGGAVWKHLAGILLGVVIFANVLSGVYLMNNLLYTTPIDHGYEVTDPAFQEGDYYLYQCR